MNFAGLFLSFSFLKFAETCDARLWLGLLMSTCISFLFLSLQPESEKWYGCNDCEMATDRGHLNKTYTNKYVWNTSQTSQQVPSLLEFVFVFLVDFLLASTSSTGLAKPGYHKNHILSCKAALIGPHGSHAADLSSFTN